MAKDNGRDPNGFDFTVFGVEGQWRSPSQIREFERLGANRVVLFLVGHDLDSILREVEDLAGTVVA